jgi:hypothetical protein
MVDINVTVICIKMNKFLVVMELAHLVGGGGVDGLLLPPTLNI